MMSKPLYAVEAVGAGVAEQLGHRDRVGVGVAFLAARGRVPRVVRPQHPDPGGVELVHDHPETGGAAGERP